MPQSRPNLLPLCKPPTLPEKTSSLPAGRQLLNWQASVHRLRTSRLLLGVAAFAGSSLLFAGSLRAQNAELDVASGLASGSNLSSATSYTAGTAPTATSDVTFAAANTYTSPYTFGSAITIGSLNDLSATAISLSGSTVTLAGGDSVSGTTGDLLFVGSGANLTFSTGSQNLVLGKTGNFDVVGTATINAFISDGSNGNSNAPTGNPFGLVKTGAGTLILTANNNYVGGTTVNAGTLQDNFGGQGYGALRGTATVNTGGTLVLNAGDAIGYNAITAGNSLAQLNISGGTVNIAVNANEGFTTNLTMTGGTFSSTGGGAFNINAASANLPTITSNASATTSLISAPVVIRSGSNLPVNVASGAAGTMNGSDLTISGIISQNGGTGSLTKNGAGILTLSGANSYTGTTTVTAGTLAVTTGGRLGSGAVTVNSGGTLLTSGTGTLGAGTSVTVAGTGALTLGNSASLSTTQTLNFAGMSVITLNNTSPDSLLNIVDTDAGTTQPQFTAGTAYTAPQLDTLFGVNSFTGGGSLIVAVPEPATWFGGLMLVGTFGFALRRRVGALLA